MDNRQVMGRTISDVSDREKIHQCTPIKPEARYEIEKLTAQERVKVKGESAQHEI